MSSGDAVYSRPLASASGKCLGRGKGGPGHHCYSPSLQSFKECEFRGYIFDGGECLQRTDKTGLKPGLSHACRRKGELELVKANYSVSKLLPDTVLGTSGCDRTLSRDQGPLRVLTCSFITIIMRDCPGGPVVKTLPFNAAGVGLIPAQGTKIPHALGCGQKIFLRNK